MQHEKTQHRQIPCVIGSFQLFSRLQASRIVGILHLFDRALHWLPAVIQAAAFPSKLFLGTGCPVD